jgi:hypothetical protein
MEVVSFGQFVGGCAEKRKTFARRSRFIFVEIRRQAATSILNFSFCVFRFYFFLCFLRYNAFLEINSREKKEMGKKRNA